MSQMIKKAVRVAVLASMTLPVSAVMAATLYGGGATLPAVPYVGPDFKAVTPNERLSTSFPGTGAPINTTSSIFGRFLTLNAHNVSYCQTGSGFGKNVLTGVTSPVGACPPGVATGFQAPQVDYIGTDSPANNTDYTNFNTNRASATAIVQYPTLTASIALPYQHSGFVGTLNLTTAQVCDIFSGVVTNWSALGLPAKAIKVVYRSDNSGTTFAFTNYLANKCNISQGGTIPNRAGGSAAWQTNQGYTTAAPPPSPLPGAVPAAGNNDLVNKVFDPLNDGAIGYADPGDVAAFAGSRWARVNTFDPMTFGGFTPLNADILVGQVVSATADPGTGLPTVSAAPTAPANFPSLLVVRPSLSVTSGYPIFAVTYIGAAKTGNGANSSALQCQGHFILNHSGVSGCTLGRPTLPVGFAYFNDAVPSVRAKLNAAINSIAP